MDCTQCGNERSSVLETRKMLRFVTKRTRECLACGHRWPTWEVPGPLFHQSEKKMLAAVDAANRRIEQRDRDINIALNLDQKGVEVLMAQHNLTRTGIYYAARRGREHLNTLQKVKNGGKIRRSG